MPFQLATISQSVSPEVPINENFTAVAPVAVFAKKASTTSGLTWGFYGGLWNTVSVNDGTVTLTNSATNFVVVDRRTGTVSASTSSANWFNGAYARLYILTTSGGVVTVIEDHRTTLGGIFGPSVKSPFISISAAYTFTITDANCSFVHPSTDTTARLWTIDSNANVPYQTGVELEFINQASAGTVTIAITTDTMRLAGAGSTGSRTLAANGHAIAKKVSSTEWLIRGTNLT